jgi:site-specific recombinase XerD
MFVTNDGDRFNYGRLRYWLRLLNREAGLRDRSLHSLRHTAGVQLAADAVPMNVIQSLLGHATIKTTGIYTELAGGELVGVLNRSGANTLLGEALEGAEG